MATARPNDKKIIVIQLNDVTNTHQTTTLVTSLTACTMFGLRWSLFVEGDAGTVGEKHDYRWTIIHQRDGTTLSDLGESNATSFYSPEQNVLAFGVGTDDNSGTAASGFNAPPSWNGKSRSKRKLMAGDKIVFMLEDIATETVRCKGTVQVFCKF